MANVGGVFVVLISGGGVGVLVSILEMLSDVRSRASELEVPFMQELIAEIRFIAKCSGNTKIVNHKKSQSRGVSIDHESRSISHSSRSPHVDAYGFRPSLKNLDKLDLMPDNEVTEDV